MKHNELFSEIRYPVTFTNALGLQTKNDLPTAHTIFLLYSIHHATVLRLSSGIALVHISYVPVD
jgi:hypothetical protein